MNIICSILLVTELVCALIWLGELLYERYEDYKLRKKEDDNQ